MIPSSWKTVTRLSHMINNMTTEDLVPDGVKSITTMVLAYRKE